ncbi:hypothetical protein BC831DRAFT_258032 [Entophlyctis helioformis]|nr:hypothetical protein BC831DRAFT_258032 [Entophlyctis helioformis]
MLHQSHDAPSLDDASKAVYMHLDKTPIAQVIKHMRRIKGPAAVSPLIAVHEDTSLASVLATMRDADILAVPVFRVLPEEPSGRMYTGIISVYDILAATVFQRMFDDMEVSKVYDMSEPEFQKYLRLMEEEQTYFATRVGSLIGTTRESAESWTLHSSDPISSLLQMLTTAGYHRILVIDDDVVSASAADDDVEGGPNVMPSGSAVRLLTQTDLVRYLFDALATIRMADVDPAFLNRLWSTTVTDVDEVAKSRARPEDVDANQVVGPSGILSRKRVVTVTDSVSALAAFRTLYLHRVSAVAVVAADSGALVSNLSASDLRGVTHSNLETLIEPVFAYLETEKRQKGQLKSDQLRTVDMDSTLDMAVARMLEAHIHRVWIVDVDERPQGVVTLTDVLSLFVPASGAVLEE